MTKCDLWHNHLGHPSAVKLRVLHNEMNLPHSLSDYLLIVRSIIWQNNASCLLPLKITEQCTILTRYTSIYGVLFMYQLLMGTNTFWPSSMIIHEPHGFTFYVQNRCGLHITKLLSLHFDSIQSPNQSCVIWQRTRIAISWVLSIERNFSLSFVCWNTSAELSCLTKTPTHS